MGRKRWDEKAISLKEKDGPKRFLQTAASTLRFLRGIRGIRERQVVVIHHRKGGTELYIDNDCDIALAERIIKHTKATSVQCTMEEIVMMPNLVKKGGRA